MSNFREDVSPLALALPTESLGRNARRALVLLIILTVFVVMSGWLSPIRSALTLLFMCTVPGAAVMSFTRRTDSLTIAALSVAISIAVCAAIASIAVWMHLYDPDALFAGTAVASAGLLFLAPWYRILLVDAGSHSRAKSTTTDNSPTHNISPTKNISPEDTYEMEPSPDGDP